MRRHSKGKKILLIILIVPVAIAVFGFIVMSLWNWLIPDLFHGPTLTFWQTLGLVLLTKILVGGFKGSHHKKWERKNRWNHKYRDMSPEEQEEFKEKWRKKWGWGCPGNEATRSPQEGTQGQ